MHARYLICFSIACAWAALGAVPALAAQAAAPAPNATAAAAANKTNGAPTKNANDNLSVNETVGDWAVRCFKVKSVAPCDVLQLATNTKTKQRLLLVSIAYVPSRQAYAMQMVVPLGVALARGMTLQAGDDSLNGVKFDRCETDGCYVEMQLPDATVKALSTMGDSTKIDLVPYQKTNTISLPLSLKGFGDAVKKMTAYARDKAATG